jgi:hypothetical protein
MGIDHVRLNSDPSTVVPSRKYTPDVSDRFNRKCIIEEQYLCFEIQEESSHVLEKATAIGSHSTQETFVKVEESDVCTTKDTADKSSEIDFPNDLSLLNVFETESTRFKKRLKG